MSGISRYKVRLVLPTICTVVFFLDSAKAYGPRALWSWCHDSAILLVQQPTIRAFKNSLIDLSIHFACIRAVSLFGNTNLRTLEDAREQGEVCQTIT